MMDTSATIKNSSVCSTVKKIHKKNCHDPKYSDNWNTPKHAYEDIRPFVEKYKHKKEIQHLVIWDPFFNSNQGSAKNYLEEVFFDATIIHENIWQDLNNPMVPSYAMEANLIITNPPYSRQNKRHTLIWLKNMEIPFMSLMPMETAMLKNMRPYLKENLQMIIPNGRISFEVEGKVKGAAPLGTTWFCFGMNFENTLNFL